jgi:predicted  nucleic acid-binding Zn-ribbon protein
MTVELPPPSGSSNPFVQGVNAGFEGVVAPKPGSGPADTIAKSGDGSNADIVLGLPRPDAAKNVVKVPVELVKGNPWFDNQVLVALSSALREAASVNGEIRRSSREASREQMNMVASLGKEQAELRFQSEIAQALMMETEAAGHIKNGIIMLGTAVMMAAAFAGPKINTVRMKRNDVELKNLKVDRDTTRNELNHMRNRDGTLPTKQDGTLDPEVDAASQRASNAQKAYDSRKDSKGYSLASTTQLSSTLSQMVQQGMGAVKEFSEAATDYEKATIQRRKASLEYMAKMAETFEKLAQKMMQTSDEDAKAAAEQLAKFLQALEQIISTNYKTFGIGVHG